MSKKKPTHVLKAAVSMTSVESKQHVRIDVVDGYFGDIKWTFFVPLSTKDKFGFIPEEIVRARMLRDFQCYARPLLDSNDAGEIMYYLWFCLVCYIVIVFDEWHAGRDVTIASLFGWGIVIPCNQLGASN